MKRLTLFSLVFIFTMSGLMANIDHYSIALKLYSENSDSAFYHINKGIELTVNRDTLAKLYYLRAYISKDPIDKIKNFRFALLQYQEIGNEKGQFNCLNNVGAILNENQLTEQAVYFYHQALKISNIPANLRAYTFHNMGVSYDKDQNLDSSILYLNKALIISDSLNMPLKGRILLDIGNAYVHGYKFRDAEAYFKKIISLGITGEIKIRALNNLGWLQKKEGNLEAAKTSFTEIIKASNVSEDLQIKAYSNLANCFTQLGDFPTALSLYEKALTLDAHNQVWLQCADYMLSYYLTNNELKKARELSKQLNMVAQEIYMRNQNINLQTNQLKINQYFYQNKLEAQREEQRQRIVYVTLSLVILVGAFAIFFMRRRYRKASYMS